MNQDTIVCIVTTQWVGTARDWIPARKRDFSLLRSTKISSGTHPGSFSMCIWVIFWWQKHLL